MKRSVEKHAEQDDLEATLKKAHALRIQFLSRPDRVRLKKPLGRTLTWRHKGSLMAAAVALAAAGVWLTIPAVPEPTSAPSSMDAALRSAPSDLPTLSAVPSDVADLTR
jgi:hypothetical protein